MPSIKNESNLLSRISLPESSDVIIDFLSKNSFPFHVETRPTAESVRRRIDQGDFSPADCEVLVISTEGGMVGLIVLSDWQDPSGMVDIRLAEEFRGQGIGLRALVELGSYCFGRHPHLMRLEGNTREDNHAMQRVFLKAGWAKEAHYRSSWPCEDGSVLDSLAYGLTRGDWTKSEVTPVRWSLGATL